MRARRSFALLSAILAVTLLPIPAGHTQNNLVTATVLHVKFKPGVAASAARASMLASGAREATPMAAMALPGSPMKGWWVARYATIDDRDAAIARLLLDSLVLQVEKSGIEQIH